MTMSETVTLPKPVVEQLCQCLAFCAWETHLTGLVVVTDPTQTRVSSPYEKAVHAADGAEVANDYEEAYQNARRLIAACGVDFDDLFPEEERTHVNFLE
jgi:hypothetical protein